MNETLNTVGRRVRYARIEAGFKSQAALAKALGRGIKPQTIQSIESGRTLESKFLPRIAIATGFEFHWLLKGEGPRKQSHPDSPRAMESSPVYQGLSDEATELARAWTHLPPDRANFFRDLIFYEAVIGRLMPWLRRGRPPGTSYDEFERRCAQDIENRQRQLQLFSAETDN